MGKRENAGRLFCQAVSEEDFMGTLWYLAPSVRKTLGSMASRRLGYLFPCLWVGWHFYHSTFTSTLFVPVYFLCEGFWGGSVVKNPPAMQEIWVQSLGLEDPSEKEMATHSSILACKILSWNGKFHAQSSLAGYNPCGCKESEATDHISRKITMSRRFSN